LTDSITLYIMYTKMYTLILNIGIAEQFRHAYSIEISPKLR